MIAETRKSIIHIIPLFPNGGSNWRFEKLFGASWRKSNLMIKILDNKLVRCTGPGSRYYGFMHMGFDGVLELMVLVPGRKVIVEHDGKEQVLVIESGPFKLIENRKTDYFECWVQSPSGKLENKSVFAVESFKRLSFI